MPSLACSLVVKWPRQAGRRDQPSKAAPQYLFTNWRASSFFLQFNKLLAVPDLSFCQGIEYLNLDHNLLGAAPEMPDGLAQLGDLPCVSRLSLSHNRLSNLDALLPCRALAELSVAENAIADLQGLAAVLAAQPALTTLVLSGNPALTHLPSRGNTSVSGTDPQDELPPDLARYLLIGCCLHLQRLVTALPTDVEGRAQVKLGSLSTLAPATPADSQGTQLQAAGAVKGGSKPPAPPSGMAVTPSEVTGAHISGSPHHPDTVPSAGSKDAHIAELLAPVPRGSPVRVKVEVGTEKQQGTRGPAFGQSATMTRFGDRLVAAADGEAGAGGAATGVGVLFVQGSAGVSVEVISRSTRDFASAYLRSAAAKRLMGVLASRSRGHGAVPVSTSTTGGGTQRSGGSRPRRRNSSQAEQKASSGGSATTGDSLASARELLAEMEGMAQKAGVPKSRRGLPGIRGGGARSRLGVDASHAPHSPDKQGGGPDGPVSPLHSRSSLAAARRAAQTGSGGATGSRPVSKSRKPTGPAVTVMAAEASAGGVPGLILWQTPPLDAEATAAQQIASTLLPADRSLLAPEQPVFQLAYDSPAAASAVTAGPTSGGGALPPIASGRSISSVSSSIPVTAAVTVAGNGTAMARWPGGGTAVKVTRDVVCSEQYVKTQVGKWVRAHKKVQAGRTAVADEQDDEDSVPSDDIAPIDVEAALSERVALFRIAAGTRESNGRSSVVSVDGFGSGSFRLPGGRVVVMLHADGSGKEYDSKGGDRATWDPSGRVKIPQGVRREYATGEPAQRRSGGAGGVGAALASGVRTIQWGACTQDVLEGAPCTTRRYLLGEGLGVQYNTVTRQVTVFFKSENIHHAFELGHNAPGVWSPPLGVTVGQEVDVFGAAVVPPALPRRKQPPPGKPSGGGGTAGSPAQSATSTSSAKGSGGGSTSAAASGSSSDLDALMSRVARLTSAEDAVEAAVKERASREGGRAGTKVGGATKSDAGLSSAPQGGVSGAGKGVKGGTAAQETDLSDLMSRVARLTSAEDAVEAAVKERASRGGGRSAGSSKGGAGGDDGASYATSAWEDSDGEGDA